MTADMDASIPWNFDGPRPDFGLGDSHYSTAANMFCRVAGGDGGLTWFMLDDNQMINEGRHLVENVFSNVKKSRFWNGRDEAPGCPYDYHCNAPQQVVVVHARSALHILKHVHSAKLKASL